MGIKQIYLTNPKKFNDVINLELLKIEYFSCNIDINPYDFLIFTSKNGVIGAQKSGIDLNSKKIICISNETATEVRKYGVEPYFVGSSGHGKDFANEIKNTIESYKSLFFRPVDVASDLQLKLRNDGIMIDSIIIYKTTCNHIQNFEVSDNSIIIFTSPKNYQCFIQNFGWKSSFTAVAIGKTTFDSFDSMVTKYCSPKTSIDSCVEFSKGLLNII